MAWYDISTAPKDGTLILLRQDGFKGTVVISAKWQKVYKDTYAWVCPVRECLVSGNWAQWSYIDG